MSVAINLIVIISPLGLVPTTSTLHVHSFSFIGRVNSFLGRLVQLVTVTASLDEVL